MKKEKKKIAEALEEPKKTVATHGRLWEITKKKNLRTKSDSVAGRCCDRSLSFYTSVQVAVHQPHTARTTCTHSTPTGKSETPMVPFPSASPTQRRLDRSRIRSTSSLLALKVQLLLQRITFSPEHPFFFSPLSSLRDSEEDREEGFRERGRPGAPDAAPPPLGHSHAALTPKLHSWSSHSWARRTPRRSLHPP